MTSEKRKELIARFSDLAREYHFRGDVVLRQQAENDLRDVASRAEFDAIIKDLYKPRQRPEEIRLAGGGK